MVCKASTEVGNVKPWGTYAAGKKEKKNELRGGRPVGCKAREVDCGGPLGAGTVKQEEKGERPVGWRARARSIVWDLNGSQ